MPSANIVPRPGYYKEPANIPVIDFGLLQGKGTAQEQDVALKQVDDAFQTYGFMYLSNHGIPQKTVDECFEWCKRFFALPQHVKQSIAHPISGDMADHRGWCYAGQASANQIFAFDEAEVEKVRETAPEKKESLELGSPLDKEVLNRWFPDDVLPGFRSFVESWWEQCVSLEQAVLKCLAQSLHLSDPDVFCKMQSLDLCHMSLAYYHSMLAAPLKNRELQRLNAHTDFGQITLVFQDMVGGLEIHDGERFLPVVPKPGTVVINVGDILERQTNGRWKSALHQVAAPREIMEAERQDESHGNGGADTVIDRFSLILFGAPDSEYVVKTLPGFEEMGKWKPNMIGEWDDELTAGQWIQQRHAAEYSSK